MSRPTRMLKTLLLSLSLALASTGALAQATAKATFAGGCFWCVEEAFDKVPGVTATISGYMGGKVAKPTYEQVSSGRTGHTEVVEVTYDPKKVTYQQLLEVFWKNHDPTYLDRQFCDLGDQYRPSIFWHDEEQRKLAEESKANAEKTKKFKQKIVTPVVKAAEFWPAEGYHQDYHLKNPVRYKFYATNCGRYSRLAELWGSK